MTTTAAAATRAASGRFLCSRLYSQFSHVSCHGIGIVVVTVIVIVIVVIVIVVSPSGGSGRC
jgi:hypothetical protein